MFFRIIITTVPKDFVKEFQKLPKAFLWKNTTSKTKHKTLCNEYRTEGLLNVNSPKKIIACHFSSIRILYNISTTLFIMVGCGLG